MIKKKNKAQTYFVSSNKNVSKGNRYLCINDVRMDFTGIRVFTKGNIYVSENNDYLTDDQNDINHQVSGFGNNSFLVENFELMISL